ncbi:hypothetical protein [Cohnella rhizosphaerae]|uniref:Uncharacterized protein n=1 Tax=Cohnella rhizosphaerae TaxID=1457232 RepID=A0A9X4KSU2_9BACL|nr:hypothetical protein [Cohnella rhizosphaerae]MDG0810486.1 hypothetical protein [Cohnella rhizosphaerae]
MKVVFFQVPQADDEKPKPPRHAVRQQDGGNDRHGRARGNAPDRRPFHLADALRQVFRRDDGDDLPARLVGFGVADEMPDAAERDEAGAPGSRPIASGEAEVALPFLARADAWIAFGIHQPIVVIENEETGVRPEVHVEQHGVDQLQGTVDFEKTGHVLAVLAADRLNDLEHGRRARRIRERFGAEYDRDGVALVHFRIPRFFPVIPLRQPYAAFPDLIVERAGVVRIERHARHVLPLLDVQLPHRVVELDRGHQRLRAKRAVRFGLPERTADR